MEQKPMHDGIPLEPPTADVAQAYLVEANTVARRREERIDRRAVGMLSMLNAVVVSLFLYLTIVGLRDRATMVTQTLLFAFIIWGQVASGVAVRNGVQWRFARRQWVMIVGAAIFGILILVSMFAAVFAGDHLDEAFVFVAPALAFAALAAIGVVQLWQARGHRPTHRRVRPPVAPGLRAVTAALGVILGGLTALMSVPESTLSVTVLLLLVLLLVAWLFAGRFSELGFPAMGELWRWPQLAAYGLSTAVLFASAASALFAGPMSVPWPAIAGGAVMVVFVLAAVIGGRDGR